MEEHVENYPKNTKEWNSSSTSLITTMVNTKQQETYAARMVPQYQKWDNV